MNVTLHLNQSDEKAEIRLNSSEKEKKPHLTDREKVSRFFQDVPRDSVRKLYEIYKLDFEMFGYDPEEYFPFL